MISFRRYSVFVKDGVNLDSIVVELETHEHTEVISVNRLLDYLIVETDDPDSLKVSGVIDVVEDKPL